MRSVMCIDQGVLQFDVNELLAVYAQMLKADKINGTDFAEDQRQYIEKHYPDIKLEEVKP